MNTEVTKFSESLSGSLEKLYRAGGFMLVFIFAGVILMIFGYLNPACSLSGWIFGVGALVNISCLFLFFFLQTKGPVRATRILKENKEMIDSIQEISIGLADAVSKFQALMFKHSENIAKVIDLSSPLFAQLPMLDELTIIETQNISEWIVNTTEKSQNIINDIRQSLVTANVNNLRKYTKELETLTQSMKAALSRQNDLATRIPDYKGQIKNFQQQLISLTDTVAILQKTVLYYTENAGRILGMSNSLPDLPYVDNTLNIVEALNLKRLSEEVKKLLLQSSQIANELKTTLEIGDSQTVLEKLIELKATSKELEGLLAVD